MSESKPSPDAAAGEGRLDGIADELYGLRPDAFTAARNEQVRQARAAGDKALARDLGALRRPTQSAWLVNMLSRDQPDAVEELLGLAADFNAALAEKDGEKLQALTAQRRDRQSQLIHRVETIANDAGVAASPDTVRDVLETLDAALTKPDVAEHVRAGRLVKAGIALTASSDRAPATMPRPKTKPAGTTVPDDGTTKARADDDEERRRETAARAIETGRQALDTAEAELAERTRGADEAREQHTQLGETLAELRDQVRELDKQVATARQAASKAERRRDQAEKARERARVALARAEQRDA